MYRQMHFLGVEEFANFPRADPSCFSFLIQLSDAFLIAIVPNLDELVIMRLEEVVV